MISGEFSVKNDEIEAGEFFVSFIDILGFGHLIKNKNFPELEKIHRSVHRFLWGIKEAHRTGKSNQYFKFYEPFPEILYGEKIFENMYNFSDSIIFYIKASDDYSENLRRFRDLCFITNIFIAKSIIQDPNLFDLPLRAGVAYGPAIMDKSNKIHMGPPIVYAHDLAESLNWMGGAIVDDSKTGCSVPEEYIKPLLGYDNEIYRYKDTPIKKKNKKGYPKEMYVLNWVRQHPNHALIRDTGKYRPVYRDIGENHVKKHKWGKETKKRDETLNFVKKICEEFDNPSLDSISLIDEKSPCINQNFTLLFKATKGVSTTSSTRYTGFR